MRYEEPPHLEPKQARPILEAAISADEAEQASAVLIGLALFDDDCSFVEEWCVRLGQEARDPALRGSAALAAGHLARRFQTLQPETRAMVKAVATDPEVDGRKYDALDDLRQFLGGHS